MRLKEKLTEEQIRQRVNARAMINTYCKRGQLTKEPCVVCGSEKSNAHHNDYYSPLDIAWVCVGCHWKFHKGQREVVDKVNSSIRTHTPNFDKSLMRHQSLIGKRFGKLVVTDFLYSKNKSRWWKCYCDCGKETTATTGVLNFGLQSCGCYNKESCTTHGYHKHPIYNVYHGMRKRCYEPNTNWYELYGGRGVTMCNEWKNNPKSFFDWAISNGYKKGLQLDKDILPKKLGIPAILYSPDYCCFVTPKQNSNAISNNVILTVGEISHTIPEWAEKTGISATTIRNRYYKNRFTHQQILSPTPLHGIIPRKKRGPYKIIKTKIQCQEN